MTIVLLISAAALLYATAQSNRQEAPTLVSNQPKSTSEDPESEEKFDTTLYSIDDPESIWVIVNKQRPLQPMTYTPTDLVVPDVPLRVPGHESMKVRAEVGNAVEQMFMAAEASGIELMLSSAFRSYSFQETLYTGYVRSQGQAQADTQSARPGYSEHQTGLAVDIISTKRICDLEQCFGETEEGKWLAENAVRFGFILRYTQDNQSTAGYSYEPWHFRYVGNELAQELQSKDVTTLEEFFNTGAAPDYN